MSRCLFSFRYLRNPWYPRVAEICFIKTEFLAWHHFLLEGHLFELVFLMLVRLYIYRRPLARPLDFNASDKRLLVARKPKYARIWRWKSSFHVPPGQGHPRVGAGVGHESEQLPWSPHFGGPRRAGQSGHGPFCRARLVLVILYCWPPALHPAASHPHQLLHVWAPHRLICPRPCTVLGSSLLQKNRHLIWC